MDVSAVNHHRPAATAPAATPTANPAAAMANPAAADKVAQEFEAMIVGQMMESMFAGLESSSTFGGGGPSEKPWRSFMLQEYGKAIAEAGTLGIGAMVREEVARLYAAQQPPQAAETVS